MYSELFDLPVGLEAEVANAISGELDRRGYAVPYLGELVPVVIALCLERRPESIHEFERLTQERVAAISRSREFHDCVLDRCDTDNRTATDVEREGFQAGILDVTYDQCPYGHTHADVRFNAWQRGRSKARGEWCASLNQPKSWHEHRAEGDCQPSRDDREDGQDFDFDDELDPCNYCPHDNTRHRGDGCMDCGCAVPQ